MSELLANLALGFSVAAHPYNIGFCLLGALVGTLVGVLPGIGTVATVALIDWYITQFQAGRVWLTLMLIITTYKPTGRSGCVCGFITIPCG